MQDKINASLQKATPAPSEHASSDACLHCSKNSDGCCKGTRVPLLLEDIQRLESLGYHADDFVVAEAYDGVHHEPHEEWWKNGFVMVEGIPYRLILKKTAEGKCLFLNDGIGCVLGERRPCICRIFPFWVNDARQVVYEPIQDICPIPDASTGICHGLACIGEKERDVLDYFDRIRHDCMNHTESHLTLVRKLLKTPLVH